MINDKLKEKIAKGEKLVLTLEEFRDKHNITCPETIYQSDRVIVDAYELIEKCVDIIGYAKYEDDFDDK